MVATDDKWSGRISFTEVRTGTDIVRYKWLMEAKLIDNLGTAIHSFRFENNLGHWDTCHGEEKTELFVDFDPALNEYNISASIPFCNGNQWDGGTVQKSGQAETMFLVERQHRGNNPDSLIGRIIERTGPEGVYQTVTVQTWEWKLGKRH